MARLLSGAIFPAVFLALAITSDAYQIVWNVPHQRCAQVAGMNLTPDIKSYGFLVNSNDQFRGDKVSLIYTPGNFSRLANTTGKARSAMELTRINGGVPQRGDLCGHLQEFADKINAQVPQTDYSGLLVLDFEDWRPIFRLNFGSMDKYRNVSQELVKEKHPEWSDDDGIVMNEATQEFEDAARLFMHATMRKTLEMRPQSKVGYYMYPLCFNTAVTTSCPIDAININNNMLWLYGLNTAMFPSIYLGERLYTEPGRAEMVRVRVAEAMRVSRLNGNNVPVWPYATYRYADTWKQVTDVDMFNIFNEPKKAGATGIVLWGSSNDFSTVEKCQWFKNYIHTVLGPLARKVIDTTW